MKKNFFSILAACSLLVSAGTATFAQKNLVPKGKAKAKAAVKKQVVQTNTLLASLPASDAVMTMDIKRMMDEAMPQILSSKPQTLGELNAKMAEFKEKTGIDLRQFEQVAIGIGYKQISAKETDFEPVMLARGKFESGAFLGLAKLAAKGKYREEKIGERTVYIFAAKEILADNKPSTGSKKTNDIFDRLMKSFTNEVAVTAFDSNTLAMGKFDRLKLMFTESKSRVDSELIALASRKPNALMSFAGNMPNGAGQFFDLDNDEIGKHINSIRKLYGSMDLSDGKGLLAVAAKTTKVEDAQGLEDMLAGLQMLGKGLLGGSKGADKQVYSRMIENAVIARKGTEVTLDLAVPKTDIDILMGVLIKDK